MVFPRGRYVLPAAKEVPVPSAAVFQPRKFKFALASVPCDARVIFAPRVDCVIVVEDAAPVPPFALKVTVATFA